MSKLKDTLNEVNTKVNMRQNRGGMDPEELTKMIGGYFEDAAFMMETIEELEVVGVNTKKKIRKLRQDFQRLQYEIEKELK